MVEKQILRLQVTVDEVQIVQVLEGQDHLSSVEARVSLAESSCFPQV